MLAGNTNSTEQSVLEQVGPNIIHHVSNSSKEHPIIRLPEFFGIDFSVTKHVLMLWVVAFIVSFVIIFPITVFRNEKEINAKKGCSFVIFIK